jgi:hypothetical protein
LQIGAGPGLAHGNGPDDFAGNELWQPTALLLLGAVVEDVRRDDTGMQGRAEGIETREAQFSADHGFVRKAATGAAVLFRHRRAEESGRAGFRPDLSVIHTLLVPALQVRHILGRNEALCLLLEQHEILGHPAGTREVENVHDEPH